MWTFISALNIQQNVVFVAIHLLVEVNVDYSEGVYVCDITTSDTNQNNKTNVTLTKRMDNIYQGTQ